MTIEEIYQEHAKLVYHFLLSLCHDQDLSEELTQETFYQALKQLDRFRGESSVTTWLCAIAKNQYYTYRKKHPEIDELPKALAKTHDEVVSWQAIETMRVIHSLPTEQREVVYLRLSSDLSFRQIGEIIGQTETWARVTFYRAKQKIREELYED